MTKKEKSTITVSAQSENISSVKNNEEKQHNENQQEARGFPDKEKEAMLDCYDEVSQKLSVIEQFAVWLERSKMNDYVKLMGEPKRVFWTNVLAGVGRGIGFTFGFLLLGALFLYILNQFINLPVIGDFIAELLKYIEEVKGLRI